MISTYETTPSALLQPYIKSFSLRVFDTSIYEVRKPLHAIHEIYMSFFLNEKLPLSNNVTSISDDKYIYGLHTFSRGIAYLYKGYYQIFCIVYKPNGFYQLFNISPADFTNNILSGTDLFSDRINRLQQQLQEASCFAQMVNSTEQFLLSYLSKSKAVDPHNSIQLTANMLLRLWGNIPVQWLAHEANMSMKTFKRNFTTQVGIAPKLFARIVRFNKALSLKIKNERIAWTSIANQCGYFDQMHFIKDFKTFAGETPSQYFITSPPPKEVLQNSAGKI